MAVHCGVCAGRVGSACENGGSFAVHAEFARHGWSPKISDTCEGCARELTKAITEKAIAMAVQHAVRIDELKEVLAEAEDRREHDRQNKQAFEREWALRQEREWAAQQGGEKAEERTADGSGANCSSSRSHLEGRGTQSANRVCEDSFSGTGFGAEPHREGDES